MIEIINKHFMVVNFICLLFEGSKQNMVYFLSYLSKHQNLIHKFMHIFYFSCYINKKAN